MKRRASVEDILRSVALWNIFIVGGGAACIATAFALSGRGVTAWSVIVGAAVVVVSVAMSCLVSKARGGALAGVSYLLKMALLMGAVFVVEAWIHLERTSLFVSIFFSVIASLGIDSWVILRQQGPDFDIPERGE